MTTKIDQYKAFQRASLECAAWAALIGSKYYGGGGGVGHLKSLTLGSGEASPTVYHQHSDGATNYHYMPTELKPHLEAAIKARFGELLTDALARQQEVKKRLAAEAAEEYAGLMVDAGILS